MKAFASKKIATELQDSELAKKALEMERPLTPPDIKRFRNQGEPGTKITHYGKANDNLPPPDFTYGAPSPKTTFTASDALNPNVDPLKEEQLNHKEKIYKQPPLGKSTTRYELPENVVKSDEAFGIKTLSLKDDSVAECLSSKEGNSSPSKHLKERPQTVPGITFGKPNDQKGESVTDAFNWKSAEGVLHPKRVRGSQDAPLYETFGVIPERGKLPDTAGELIHGWAQEPDKNIGKADKFGYRNTIDGAREDGRAFGIDTGILLLRQTVSRIGKRQGGTLDALLAETNKSKGEYGVDWIKERTKPELWEIVHSSGVFVSSQEFEETFEEMTNLKLGITVDSFHKTFLQLQAKKLLNITA